MEAPTQGLGGMQVAVRVSLWVRAGRWRNSIDTFSDAWTLTSPGAAITRLGD